MCSGTSPGTSHDTNAGTLCLNMAYMTGEVRRLGAAIFLGQKKCYLTMSLCVSVQVIAVAIPLGAGIGIGLGIQDEVKGWYRVGLSRAPPMWCKSLCLGMLCTVRVFGIQRHRHVRDCACADLEEAQLEPTKVGVWPCMERSVHSDGGGIVGGEPYTTGLTCKPEECKALCSHVVYTGVEGPCVYCEDLVALRILCAGLTVVHTTKGELSLYRLSG